MTMVLMYVSSQTTPGTAALEDGDIKNKIKSLVRNLENKIIHNIFFSLKRYEEIVYNAIKRRYETITLGYPSSLL